MREYKNVPLRAEQHKRLKLLAAKHVVSMATLIVRALDLYEAQTELPHPADGTPVPLVYQEQKSK